VTPERRRLLARYRTMLAAHSDRTSAVLAAMWARLGSYDESDIAVFAAAAAPVLAGAKTATVATSTAFTSRMLQIRPPAVDPEMVASVVDLRQPFAATWHALAEGRPYSEAVTVGRSVTEATARDYVTSTARLTGDEVTRTVDRPVRWQRVANPGACAWCMERDGGVYPSASDGDYGHERCSCDVVPIET
jgi:hypothetical protein